MIRFEHVSKQYSGTARPALNGINLEVLRGEFVFLVGASGSGKSSCLRLILKEEKPTKGKIHVLGQDLGSISSRKVPYFRRNIGVVFQDFRLLPNKTVFQNVAFTLQVIGKSRGFIQEAVPDVLKMVGLDGKAQRLPHELSGGEQQRVAIARAVVNKPQVLLADEPTGNLDPATSAGIMATLERINAGGTTVIMATHEAAIVDQMKRRVIELVGGQIVRDERHGGYGFTAAVPIAQPLEREEPVPVAAPVPVSAPAHVGGIAAHRAAPAEAPMTRPHAPTSVPTAPVAVPQQTAPVQPLPPQQQPVQQTAQQQPVPPAPASEELPEHLNFTANLDLSGLREGADRQGDQNVGPTK
ncbi:cell division ATP-binding protein FtsE [Leifsonia sp. 2MCAF36]|uniref:cell division ATP-binding protein FtsE n=1 Tax=Leifsonia sp. 2MCAF36 TaxID=3232988 RepID=UPI003F9DD71D